MGEIDQKSRYLRIADLPRSAIGAIPYYPNLHRQLHNSTASILLAYLEIHHPPPQDDPGGFVTLDADAVALDIQINRRTLLTALSQIGVWWKNEEAAARGARAMRMFTQPNHSRYGTTKPYSITGPKSWHRPVTWALRRNWPFLRFILRQANAAIDDDDDSIINALNSNSITANSATPPPPPTLLVIPTVTPTVIPTPRADTETTGGGASSGTVFRSLSELIVEASVLGGDGRRSRQDRARAMRSVAVGEVGRKSN